MEPLQQRVAGVAANVRRDAVAALITKHMPLVPVERKKPVWHAFDDGEQSPHERNADKTRPAAQPRIFRTKSRRRRLSRDYVATGKPDTSRAGTFRRYMLSTIILPANNTAHALRIHAVLGEYADQKIDFNWAAKEGYIRFI